MLEHRAIVLDYREWGLELVGNIGDEVRAQGFHAAQLLYHLVKVVDDDVEARFDTANRLYAGREITVHNPLCTVDNALDRTLHRKLSTQQIHRRTHKAQHKHVAECDKCRKLNITLGKYHIHRLSQISQEKIHGACEHEGDQQEKDTEQLEKCDLFPVLFLLHLSTAL